MPVPTRFCARLAGKVVVVTGAGARAGGIGVGRAIALYCAGEGARVGLLDRDGAAAAETAALIASAGGTSLPFEGDVLLEDDCARFVESVFAQYGNIDTLVNNVGVTGPVDSVTAVDLDQWSNTIDTNLRSAVLMCRHAIPKMVANGGGSIINISSLGGQRAHGTTAYGPSKAALEALTRELAVMHGRQGIRANAIAPGHIWTAMAQNSGMTSARSTRRHIAPLPVEGDAWDIAAAAVFLASDESRFISGVTLPVDGGVSIIGPLVAHAIANAADTSSGGDA